MRTSMCIVLYIHLLPKHAPCNLNSALFAGLCVYNIMIIWTDRTYQMHTMQASLCIWLLEDDKHFPQKGISWWSRVYLMNLINKWVASQRSSYHRENYFRVKKWSLTVSRHAFSELRKSLPSRKLTYELLRTNAVILTHDSVFYDDEDW